MPKVNVVHREWVTIKRSNGVAAPGVDPGDVTVTIRNPADNASSIVAIVESVLGGGLYFFDIPAAFSLSHGVGDYGILIDIDSNSPKVRDISGGSVEYRVNNLDDLALAAGVSALTTSLAATGISVADIATFLGLVLGTPCVHTPTTITAGGQTHSVVVVGSTVTITRLT